MELLNSQQPSRCSRNAGLVPPSKHSTRCLKITTLSWILYIIHSSDFGHPNSIWFAIKYIYLGFFYDSFLVASFLLTFDVKNADFLQKISYFRYPRTVVFLRHPVIKIFNTKLNLVHLIIFLHHFTLRN